MRNLAAGCVGLIAMFGVASAARAQTPTANSSSRLAAVLPADVAQHILSVVRQARTDGLPAEAIENRSLKFAARGIAPTEIARAADEQLARMRDVRDVLRRARPQSPNSAEIEAGAEAMREGVDGAAVSRLAQSAPSGRSLAVPLYVIGSLVSRGLPSDQALARVQSKLVARATDADIQQDGQDASASQRDGSPGNSGNAPGRGDNGNNGNAGNNGKSGNNGSNGNNGHGAGRPQGAGSGGHGNGNGPPAGVPGNAGAKGRPGNSGGNGPSKPGKGHP
jgi:hypothetical protein